VQLQEKRSPRATSTITFEVSLNSDCPHRTRIHRPSLVGILCTPRPASLLKISAASPAMENIFCTPNSWNSTPLPENRSLLTQLCRVDSDYVCRFAAGLGLGDR
jgi:hypothetical protein